MQFQDPSKPVDIVCGTMMPLRSSRFASVLEYTHDFESAPQAAEDKCFEFNNIVVTTRGSWQFHGVSGKTEVGSDVVTAGAEGLRYGCRHHRDCGDSNLVAALRPTALDPGYGRIFEKQLLPARGSLALLRRAVALTNDDHFDSLIFMLFDEISRTSTSSSRVAPRGLRMQRAKRFIELHAFERITVADIASALGLSPFTFLREFREVIGKTPYAYLLELRLERAKVLLAQTGESVLSVGNQVGFDELAHFSSFFKKSTGYSPSSFRALRE